MYVKALCDEIELRKGYISEPIQTVYFGGGTPSLLSLENIQIIWNKLNETFDLSKCEEVTLEANPDDCSKEFLQGIKNIGINRLSIGVQSLDDNRLIFLNRRHTAQQAKEVVTTAVSLGITNISIDLIYGFPNQTIDDLLNDLNQAVALPIKHLSVYHLTYEKGTALYRLYQQGKIQQISEELSSNMNDVIMKFFDNQTIKQYEISNFAIPGYESKHNSAYWKGVKYLGLGAGAHSYDGHSRQWNVNSLSDYLAAISNGKLDFEKEEIDEVMAYNEFIMTRLRTIKGFDLSEMPTSSNQDFVQHFLTEVAKHIRSGNIVKEGSHYRLSRQGVFVSDGIIADLFVDEEMDS